MVDVNGDEAGRMLYDGFGAVLTNTLPLTLTGTLPDVPDTATGLAHLGGGRWYDPALGRPLQPNPMGGPPTLPQALNRYAATALGQPGVAQAANSAEMLSCCNLFDFAVDLAAVTTGNRLGLAAYLTSRTASIVYSGSGLPRFARNLNDQGGVRVWSNAYSPASPHPSAHVNENRMRWLQKHLDNETLALSKPSRWNRTMNYDVMPIARRLGFSIDEFSVGKALDGGAIGFGFDAVWQLAQDGGNPYLSPSDKLYRAGITGGVGFFAGAIVVATVGTGLVGFFVSVGVGWLVEAPISNWIFQRVGLIPTRHLAPFH